MSVLNYCLWCVYVSFQYGIALANQQQVQVNFNRKTARSVSKSGRLMGDMMMMMNHQKASNA